MAMFKLISALAFLLVFLPFSNEDTFQRRCILIKKLISFRVALRMHDFNAIRTQLVRMAFQFQERCLSAVRREKTLGRT